ncbi:unnamed protein product [Clonostachys rosea]|uniref:Putative gamma-glutamylcyclotransferase n=1 Tax=Bionectria ochroleuca TaxID=29856 RepID=A0ABY6URR8_BIOOC|nr:unnamed protein product [Clonostachys rosea]
MSQAQPNEERTVGEAHPTPQRRERGKNQPASLMARKFLNASDDDVWMPDEDLIRQEMEKTRAGKEMYFFYGSLMDPATLRRVAGLEESPRLRPAHVVGYETKLWGPYPALLDGPPGHIVRGMACEIEGGEAKDRLAAYETANYGVKLCLIEFDDGTKVKDKTFRYAGFEIEAGNMNSYVFYRRSPTCTNTMRTAAYLENHIISGSAD